jgi:hypothetical protein
MAEAVVVAEAIEAASCTGDSSLQRV